MKGKFLTCLALSVCLHVLVFVPWLGLTQPSPRRAMETIPIEMVPAIPQDIWKAYQIASPHQDKTKKAQHAKSTASRNDSAHRARRVHAEPFPEGVSFEAEGMVNLDYMERLKARIFHAWEYPESAIAAGHQGTVKIAFVVDESGTLIGMGLLDSSGYRELDRSAMHAIKAASPFGSFPPDIPKKNLKIKGRFRYVLD
jgi:TonB family protein